jgi:hypothetical protein
MKSGNSRNTREERGVGHQFNGGPLKTNLEWAVQWLILVCVVAFWVGVFYLGNVLKK